MLVYLLVEPAQYPQKHGQVPIVSQKHLRIAEGVGELLCQFFLREHRNEFVCLLTLIGVGAPTRGATNNLVSHHISQFAVVRTGPQITL
jgi:hypothetical protein